MVEKVIAFIIERMPLYKGQEKLIKEIVSKHIEYGTFDYEEDYSGLVYCVRYNISPSGKIADVLDLCVRDKEALGVFKYIIVKNMQRWPRVEAIRFIRGKNKSRESIYKLSYILKKEIKWAAVLK